MAVVGRNEGLDRSDDQRVGEALADPGPAEGAPAAGGGVVTRRPPTGAPRRTGYWMMMLMPSMRSAIPHVMRIRDSKNRAAGFLRIDKGALASLLNDVKSGRYDL
ncbi:hypothetical protein GCM10009780_19700 [Actinomadura alba]